MVPRRPWAHRKWRFLLNPPILAYSLLRDWLAPLVLLAKIRWLDQSTREAYLLRWKVRPITPDKISRFLSSDRPHVVFIGAGFGEIQVFLPVLLEMKRLNPDFNVTYCLRDPAIIDLYRRKEPDLSIATWPYDGYIPVYRWLKFNQPDLLVFTERFRFPIFSCGASAARSKVALVNGRFKERRSTLYKLLAPYYNWQYSAFDLMLLQTEENLAAARDALPPGVKVEAPGDLKLDRPMPTLPETAIAEIETWLGIPTDVPFVIAGSTWDINEDRMIFEAFKEARRDCPCNLILASRNIWRSAEIVQLANDLGLRTSLRTNPTGPADVFVLDTLGELSFVYRYADVAYVGGAFGVGDGHNIMEPLRYGIPTAYGTNRGHFASQQLLAEEHGVGTRIANSDELAAHWRNYLSNPELAAGLAETAKRIADPQSGAIAKSAKALLELVGLADSN